MEQRFSSISTTSWDFECKSDILTYVIVNPTNKIEAKKLSKINFDLFGSDQANLFVKRHNNELQRCSQFYSLASIFNETSSKDKHHTNGIISRRNILMDENILCSYFDVFNKR